MNRRFLLGLTLAALVISPLGCRHIDSGAQSVVGDVRAAVQPERAQLLDELEAIFEDERFARGFFGVKIKSLETGEVWYDRNAHRLFMPASNQKIPTTAAALRFLGPDFQFTTDLRHTGEISDGVLHGDLVVVGNGDPTLYTRFYDKPTQLFDLWAENLKARGITRINGDIIGDDNAWEDRHVHWSWPQNLSNWYYAELGPLQVNENYVDLKIIPPATVDGLVMIEPNLPSAYYTLDTNIEVVAEGRNSINLFRPAGTNTIRVTGRVVAGSAPFEETPTITNPTLFYVTVLKESLEANGISVSGNAVDCDDIDGYGEATVEGSKLLGTAKSPELIEILKLMMKRSQNVYAESMVMTMGWKDTGRGSYSAGGAVVRREMEALGVASGSFIYGDGSGLSRSNYTSPEMLVQINSAMHDSELFEQWYDTYPIAGVDGTIARRMRDTPAEGNARAKTGLIANVRALSGYVTTASGELLAFSMLVNNHTRSSAEADGVFDSAVVKLAEYTGR